MREEDWASAPTVLWLNGGPGSSSVLGWLREIGPLLVSATGGLMRNPWAWTRQANVFVLESPAGVGYSYCEAQRGGGACANTDNSTAATSLAALERFFFEKFPALAANDFFVTGESYAGVYVPTLARAILERNERMLNDTSRLIPLAGVAVGDPCTDNAAQKTPWTRCGTRTSTGSSRRRTLISCGTRAGTDRRTRARAHEPWEMAPGLERAGGVARRGEGRGEREERIPEFPESPAGEKRFLTKNAAACVAAARRFRLVTSDGFSQSWRLAWLNDLSLYGPAAVVADDVPGTLDNDMARWMRRADTRAALHVEASPATEWPGPNDGWRYESQWSACNDHARDGVPSMVAFYRYLAPRLNTTIVFNGDTDPCVSYEGTRAAMETVGFPLVFGGNQRPYFARLGGVGAATLKQKPLLFGPDLSVQQPGVQFLGHVTTYTHNLQFVTVHGSGHMVPHSALAPPRTCCASC